MYACYAFDFGVVLAWFPKYLTAERHMDLKTMGFYASLPLLAGVLGGITGGTVSDYLIKTKTNLKMARRLVAVTGFVLAAIMIPVSVLTGNPVLGVLLFSAAVFALELTVGCSWAVTLDIGGEFAGSVSAAMNTGGNLAGAFATTLTGYMVKYYGWDAAFFVLAGVAALAAVLFLRIDASKPLFAPAANAMH
jgi:sugar phosphate permease